MVCFGRHDQPTVTGGNGVLDYQRAIGEGRVRLEVWANHKRHRTGPLTLVWKPFSLRPSSFPDATREIILRAAGHSPLTNFIPYRFPTDCYAHVLHLLSPLRPLPLFTDWDREDLVFDLQFLTCAFLRQCKPLGPPSLDVLIVSSTTALSPAMAPS